MANYNPYSTNSYQATQMFPQPQGTVTGCMWHETHEMFQHWYDEIERKIKRYS